MAQAKLTSTALDFTSDGSASNVKLNVTQNDQLSLTSAGGNGVRLSGLTTPQSSTDAATKQYVDSIAQGLQVKASVRAATAANGTLATAFANGQTVDGVAVATGDRVLLKDQTTQSENGIYIVQASGAPARAADMAATSSAAGAFLFVEEGTANGDKGFVCTSNQVADTVGTHSLTFAQFSGAGGGGSTVVAGTNLSKSGDTISVIDGPTFASAITAATGSAVGNLTLADGSITDSSGAISFGDENLSTTGSFTAATLTATSDERLKTDITEIGAEEAAGLLRQLRCVRFQWRDAAMREAHGDQVGLIAQEVEAVVPEVVVTSATGTKSVDYAKLNALIIAALQPQLAAAAAPAPSPPSS